MLSGLRLCQALPLWASACSSAWGREIAGVGSTEKIAEKTLWSVKEKHTCWFSRKLHHEWIHVDLVEFFEIRKVKSAVRTALPLSLFSCSRQVFVIWDMSEPTWGSACCCYQSWHRQVRQPVWSFKLSQVSANSQTCWIQWENSTNVTYVKRGFPKSESCRGRET